MGGFRTSDAGPEPDWLQVAETAGLLDVSEFELFDLAYRDWYGRAAAPAELERNFARFMFQDVVPFWLRRYCRRIRRPIRHGPAARGSLPTPAGRLPARPRRWLLLVAVWLLLLPTVLVLLVQCSSDLMPFLSECYFPPCY